MTDDRRAADRMLTGVLAPMLRRSADAMRELTLPIGSPEHCAHAISAYAQAGAERIFLWPLADEIQPTPALPRRRGPARRVQPVNAATSSALLQR